MWPWSMNNVFINCVTLVSKIFFGERTLSAHMYGGHFVIVIVVVVVASVRAKVYTQKNRENVMSSTYRDNTMVGCVCECLDML